MKSYILSQYPLTLLYCDQVSKVIGERLEPLVISNIPANSSFGLLRILLSIQADTLYLPKTDQLNTPLLPILKCLSLLVRARKRALVEPDFSIRPFGLFDGMKELIVLGFGIIEGILDLISYWLTLHCLPEPSPIPFSEIQIRRCLYLRTNLSLGIQAGGAFAHTRGVLTSLLRKNYQIDYASCEPPIDLPEGKGFNILHLMPSKRFVIPRDLNYFSNSIHLFKQIIKTATSSYDFIYQRHSLGNLTGVQTSHLLSVPLILEYNGSEVWLAANWGKPLLFNKLAEKAEEACLKHASIIVTVSDVLRDELVGRGVEPERIVTCPNGVNPDIFNAQRFCPQQIEDVRKRHGIGNDAVVATFVGTFGHWHGAEELAKTLSLMVIQNREWLEQQKLHIMFIGDGAKRKMVEEILSDSELHPFYTLTGLVPQNEAPLYMAASNILISPHVPNTDGSPFFGSPTKLFEYMSTGRAVIASALFQIRDVLEGSPMISDKIDFSLPPGDDVCGIMIMPKKPEELRSAIQALVENPDWRKLAGLNGRKRVIDRYTWDHHTDAILNKFRS